MFQNLRRHINRSTNTCSGHSPSFREEFSKPEVTYLEYLTMHQYVGCLQVTVDDPEFTELLKALCYLPDNDESRFFRGSSGGTESLEISPGAVFHNEIDVVLSVDDLSVSRCTS